MTTEVVPSGAGVVATPAEILPISARVVATTAAVLASNSGALATKVAGRPGKTALLHPGAGVQLRNNHPGNMRDRVPSRWMACFSAPATCRPTRPAMAQAE